MAVAAAGGIAAAVTRGMLYATATPTVEGFRDIAAATLAADRARVRIVDVREPHELTGELGHIPGIEHVPLAQLASRAAAWPRHEPIVLVCRSGARSATAARWLVAAGFERVMNLAGGMLAYRAAGLPVTHR